MAAKLVLKQGSTGKYRFNLVATDGQVIATREAYESKASAKGLRVGKAQRSQRRERRADGHVLWIRPTPASVLPCPAGDR